jgi:hypothetical protein
VQTFGFKAEFLVKRNCVDVGFSHRQLDAGKPKCERRVDRPLHKLATNSMAAILWQKPHTERPAMSLHGSVRAGKHIAPAADSIIDEDNKLRIARFDILENERPHLLEWRRFQKRKKSLLARDSIQRFAKTSDVMFGDRVDFIDHDDFCPQPSIVVNRKDDVRRKEC